MYDVKVILDSICRGHRLTTLQCTFPRFILAEVNTHRMFSRNSASSRAIPVPKRIAQIEADPFVPIAFGKNQAGMQAMTELDAAEQSVAVGSWIGAVQDALKWAQALVSAGVHKQWANRVIETYAWHTAVISSTEWANHEGLRCHPAASPEYQTLAKMMRDAKNASTPLELKEGDWHLPYVFGMNGELLDPADAEALTQLTGKDVITQEGVKILRKVSVGRCAAVSYERQEIKNFTKDVDRYASMRGGGHMSPLEHVARPMDHREYTNLFCQKEVTWNEDSQNWEWVVGEYTHYCGNFQGWVQDRKMIPNEHDFSKIAKTA